MLAWSAHCSYTRTMSMGEFDQWLDTEQRHFDARMAALRQLAQLAELTGGTLDHVQVLVDRLRAASPEQLLTFRNAAHEVLGILGVIAPAGDDVDSKGTNLSDYTDSVGERPDRVEYAGNPWLQRITVEELDGITTTDHAMCHIREAVSELIAMCEIDPEYIKADFCTGMLARLGGQCMSVYDVTDDYLESLLETALEYPKKVPMSTQIVNGICFMASLKGVPLKAQFPYRALTWGSERYGRVSQDNVNASRYAIERYVQSARRDELQQAQETERRRVKDAFETITRNMQHDGE